jgi:hypothetical protein
MMMRKCRRWQGKYIQALMMSTSKELRFCFFFAASGSFSTRTPSQSHAQAAPQISDIGLASAEGTSLQNLNSICDFQSVEINPTQVNSDSAALNTYFQSGFQGEDSSDDEDEELAGDVVDNEGSHVVDNAKTHDALAWADNFILKTRRRGGRETENSVLKQWKVR